MPDRPLPASVDAERSILGAILLDNAAYEQAAAVLRPDHFSLDSHRRIYARICELSKKGQPIDLITLTEQLGQYREVEKVGGVAYLSGLTEGLPHRPNIDHYVRIVRDKATLRGVIHACNGLVAKAFEPSETAESVLSTAQQTIAQVAEQGTAPGCIRTLADVPDVYTIDTRGVDYIVPDTIPRGSVVLLTGEPGVGKSFLTLRLAIACAIGGSFLGHRCEQLPCLILDRENPIPLVQQRMDIFSGGPIPGLHIWGGWLQDEPPLLGDPRLLSIARDSKPLMIFDSLVRFHAADENSATEMKEIMAHLRKLADAGATVIALHHRAKAQESKYRGSTDILAAVDMAYTLKAIEPGLLQLHRFKSRFSGEQITNITADFASGRFEVGANDEVDSDDAADIEFILALITKHPGASQRGICGKVQEDGISRTRALSILRRETGRLWRTEEGANRSILYFPIDYEHECSGVPPYRAAEHQNTTLAECSGVPRNTSGTHGTRNR